MPAPSFHFRFSIALLFFLATTLCVQAQVSGCKDPAAANYNPSATVNDGHCMYNSTSYTPPVKVTLSSTLDETSGLQWAGTSLWTFNDGGPAATPTLYRIDTGSNTIQQTVTLAGASNVDWEDIAFDGTNFYIGDFGNNNTGTRTDLKIYKFPLSAIPSDYATSPSVTIPSSQIEVINFSYSDQTDFSKDTANYTRFDCEAMIVDGGNIHLFTKNWIDLNTTHYIINGTTGGTYIASPVETLPTGYLVTAADKSPNGKIVVLLGYQASGFGSHFMHILSDFNSGFYFNGNKRMINLPGALTMGQAEGITFLTNTYGFISNEAITSFGITPKLRAFNTESFTPAYVLPLDLLNFTVANNADKQLVQWDFASEVNDLQVVYSVNGGAFNSLQTFGSSRSGSLINTPKGGSGCYQLRWQLNGRTKYSNTVCANAVLNDGLKNVVLNKRGQLNFLCGIQDVFTFRLVTMDGRLLEQTGSAPVGVGINTVKFSKPLQNGSIVLLQAQSQRGQQSILLLVQQ